MVRRARRAAPGPDAVRAALVQGGGDRLTRYVLTLDCPDRIGIVFAVSEFLASVDGFILDSQQFADLDSGRFFMRLLLQASGSRFPGNLASLIAAFAPVGQTFAMDWAIADAAVPLRVMIAVSQSSHCLNDLLHRWSTGNLPIDITAIVSNHENCRALSEWHGLPYYWLPVDDASRTDQEAQIAGLIAETGTELLVLARYMQVLTPAFARSLAGRCINIHHGYLPGFKGARPYHRAHARGVKLIGATAHYVTHDLDEGPIIEQAVERVDHRATIADMIRTGRDLEAQALSRAVGWAAERRILLNGDKTIVFR